MHLMLVSALQRQCKVTLEPGPGVSSYLVVANLNAIGEGPS